MTALVHMILILYMKNFGEEMFGTNKLVSAYAKCISGVYVNIGKEHFGE